MKTKLQIRKRGRIWPMPCDKDRTSVKEDIGHSYKKRVFFFQRDKNKIMFKHNPSEMSMKPMKTHKVNIELYIIAGNQYFLLIPHINAKTNNLSCI